MTMMILQGCVSQQPALLSTIHTHTKMGEYLNAFRLKHVKFKIGSCLLTFFVHCTNTLKHHNVLNRLPGNKAEIERLTASSNAFQKQTLSDRPDPRSVQNVNLSPYKTYRSA